MKPFCVGLLLGSSFVGPRYSERLFDARADLFSEGVSAAGSKLQQLLVEATTPFWEAGIE